MILKLKIFSRAPTESEGILTFPDGDTLAIIGQPWVPNPNGAKGGLPFHSCVPDGMYRLAPWMRPNGDEVYIMLNPELGVHATPQDHVKDYERDLCLFHRANFASDLKGCWAPGLKRAIFRNRKTGKYERAVTSSGRAMNIMRAKLGNEKLGYWAPHILLIESVIGANDAT